MNKLIPLNYRKILTIEGLIYIIIIFINCGGQNQPLIKDPTSVDIQELGNYEIGAIVVHNGIRYTQNSWPNNFSDPRFTWVEEDPRSNSANYKVEYSHFRRSITQNNLWTYSVNDSEGTYYYYAHVQFMVDGDSQQGQSSSHIDYFTCSNSSGYTESHTSYAAFYIRVPYVLGVVQDLDGKNCGKTIDEGLRGIDCSGLAYWSGYHGDTTVGWTDVNRLDNLYGKNLPLDSLNKIIIAIDTLYLNGCMVYVQDSGTTYPNHVGIILNQNTIYYSQVIHATPAYKIESRYEHGCMVMREDLIDRSYWSNQYRYHDIGRLPMHSRIGRVK